MHKQANESVAVMLEKLASDMDSYADYLSQNQNQRSENKNNMTTKTASVEYGSLDSRRPASGTDTFVSWLIGG